MQEQLFPFPFPFPPIKNGKTAVASAVFKLYFVELCVVSDTKYNFGEYIITGSCLIKY